MLPTQTPTQASPAAAPPHPELPPGIDLELADRVIYLCISDKLRPNDIADRLELSLFTVGLIIHSPYGVETRALLKDLDEIRAEIHARHHHMRAMAATADLCETAVREETRRLAAAAIIRGVPYYPSEREQRSTNTPTAKRRAAPRHQAEPLIHEPTAPAAAHPLAVQVPEPAEPVGLDIAEIDDTPVESSLAEEAAAIARVEVIRHRMAEALARFRTAPPDIPALTPTSTPLNTRARDAPQAA